MNQMMNGSSRSTANWASQIGVQPSQTCFLFTSRPTRHRREMETFQVPALHRRLHVLIWSKACIAVPLYDYKKLGAGRCIGNIEGCL